MIRLEIGLEIRHGGVMRVCAIEDKTAVVVVASYRSVSRNPVRFKALLLYHQTPCITRRNMFKIMYQTRAPVFHHGMKT